MAKTKEAFVRERASYRCEYCRMPQSAHVLTFPIDHIIARQHGGSSDLENLALSCVRCNSFKGPNIAGIDPQTSRILRLYHPRKDRWDENFSFEGATLFGLSEVGRTTLQLLQMNHPDYLALRTALIAEGITFG